MGDCFQNDGPARRGRNDPHAPVNDATTEIDISEILTRIPHRYPRSWLVARRRTTSPNSIESSASVAYGNEPFFSFFQGIFRPIRDASVLIV